VEALPALLERVVAVHPSTRMVIVGSGPLLSDLKKEFAKRNLVDRAIFPGAVAHDEVALILREFDIALAPYPEHAHAFYFSPLKLFEYLACGVATVAADVGQIREIVTHRQNGWLYPPGDFEALVDGCSSLLGDPSLRKQLGEAGARLVHEHYTWDHNVRRVESVFRQLTAPKGE
jgi:glycosyltransferase involved in cell wall biosynthesis